MPELLLAIDVGTTTLSACVVSPAGEMLGQASEAASSKSPAAGQIEQHAGRIWRNTRDAARRALAASGRPAADLAAIGVTSQRTSAVCWDRRTGRPLTPLVVWSDLRGADRAAELQALGYPVFAQQAAAKLEAMVASIPNAASLIHQGRLAWGNIDAFVVWKLTGGAHLTDRSQAWPTGYLDLATLDWNQRLIEAQALDPACFPSLVDTWGPLAVSHRDFLGAEVPLTAVIADQQAAMIGQGCETAGDCKLSYGTSAALDVATGGEFIYRGGAIPPFVLSSVQGETRFCLEGMVYSAGSALDWVRQTFGLGDHRRFEALAASVPDSGGAAFLPALQGLGAPYADLARRGAFAGLSLDVARPHMALAAMEGVAFRVREAFDHIFEATGLDVPAMLKVDGGLTASAVLMQAQADILGRPVARHALREATAVGAAICAARGAGLFGPDETGGLVRHDRTFEPRLSADEAQSRLSAWRALVYGGPA